MSNSREDSHVGEENTNDAIPLEGVQEVKGVEEASHDDDEVEYKKLKELKRHHMMMMSVTRKDDRTSCIETREFDPIIARQKIATLVVKHELPLNFVEYEAFRDLMSYANPLVKNLSINTLKSEIFKLYQAEKTKTMALLENNDSRVAITTDMWTASNQKKGYMVVTRHFVDKSWRLQSRILRRISVVTLDNCSTNDAMVDRDSVAYWTGTPKRVETFDMAARQLQVKCEKKLVFDCVTRWNSTNVMLDVAVKYKIVFSRLQQCDKHYTSLPTDEEWEMAEKMLEYLLPFYSMTELFSVILDPRFKMQLVNYYFPQLYGEGAVNEIQMVRNLSNDLVKFYEVKSGNVSDAVVGESSLADVRFNFNLGTGHKFFDIRKFEAFVSQNSETNVSKSDLERYLEEPLIKSTSDFDILNWWKVNQGKYPILAQMAKDILAVLVTTAASESTFSTGGRVLTSHRSRLHPTTLEVLMCTQHWLWANSKGKILESEIFNGEELVDEDESGPQVLE
ncbi:BED-type domain-containing protein [Citrus sinensis]|uniref:BED-type domain-containing protein n=1 Tax=Citrus sinensis TaxID=2711 RepID=A0ACB8LU20_CITSI|nr:BED-type domain-containing protein [Citrus sinensis]